MKINRKIVTSIIAILAAIAVIWGWCKMRAAKKKERKYDEPR